MTNVGQFLPEPRRVVLLTPPGGQLIGMIGVLEAFDAVNRYRAARGRPRPYRLELAGVGDTTGSIAGPITRTTPAHSIDALHTLVVGGSLPDAHEGDPGFLEEVRRLAERAERVVSVCMGAFSLGRIGWLDGRRCTTHWMALDALRAEFPHARVAADAIYTEDGPVFTSAGATAGIDLALHLIRQDCGPRMALAVARALVVFAHRPGGQSQFGTAVQLRPGLDQRLHDLVAGIVQDPAGDHGVEALARRAGMSPRNFARVFREQSGETPAAFVARVRVEAAQRALANSDASITAVASDCGFGSVETLRRSFARIAGVSPSQYRERFQVI